MQTFITSTSYDECAQALDDKRLKNQRNEALVILRTLLGEYPSGGWKHHPNVTRWKGYESQLIAYAVAMCNEIRERGIKSKHGDETPFCELVVKHQIVWAGSKLPPFITAELIAEHKRILKEKQGE